VAITISYRLGVFGYLWDSDPVRRNLGLQDQLAAFDWVLANVERFGGDPDNVTAFGQSSGGHSIAAMLRVRGPARPFRRMILQSAPLGAVALAGRRHEGGRRRPWAAEVPAGVRRRGRSGCCGRRRDGDPVFQHAVRPVLRTRHTAVQKGSTRLQVGARRRIALHRPARRRSVGGQLVRRSRTEDFTRRASPNR